MHSWFPAVHKIPKFLAFSGQLLTSFCAEKPRALSGDRQVVTACLAASTAKNKMEYFTGTRV
jgi:hypothetical protein